MKCGAVRSWLPLRDSHILQTKEMLLTESQNTRGVTPRNLILGTATSDPIASQIRPCELLSVRIASLSFVSQMNLKVTLCM